MIIICKSGVLMDTLGVAELILDSACVERKARVGGGESEVYALLDDLIVIVVLYCSFRCSRYGSKILYLAMCLIFLRLVGRFDTSSVLWF